MRCIILGSSEYYNTGIPVKSGDLIIAADGGYAAALKAGIKPDIHLGDMDSGDKTENAILLPKEKNDTDTFYAVRKGLEKGCDTFLIYGGTGGRSAHTIANIQTLAYISKQGAAGYLIDKDVVYTAVTNGTLRLEKRDSGYISVFSLSDVSRGVSISGLKYCLKDAVITNDYPYGVSNEYVGESAFVSVKEGTLLCVFPKDDGKY